MHTADHDRRLALAAMDAAARLDTAAELAGRIDRQYDVHAPRYRAARRKARRAQYLAQRAASILKEIKHEMAPTNHAEPCGDCGGLRQQNAICRCDPAHPDHHREETK